MAPILKRRKESLMSEMPSPPFPDPESDVLRMVVDNALAAYKRQELDVRQAIALELSQCQATASTFRHE
jgi:hypothetical protein